MLGQAHRDEEGETGEAEGISGDSGGGPERKVSLTEECKGPGTRNNNREEEAESSH